MVVDDKQTAALFMEIILLISIKRCSEIMYGSKSPENLTSAQKSIREQIDAILYPYLNTMETQKRFAWLVEKFEFIKWLGREYSEFIAFIRAKDILDFQMTQEKLSKEQYKIQQLDAYALAKIREALLEKIDLLIKELKEQIAKLENEIKKLDAQKNTLLTEIHHLSERLEPLLLDVFTNIPLQAVPTVINIGGYELAIQLRALGIRIADAIRGRVASGEIPADKINDEIRDIIRKKITKDIPEAYLSFAGDYVIESVVNEIFNLFDNARKQDPRNADVEGIVELIVDKASKVQKIDVEILGMEKEIDENMNKVNQLGVTKKYLPVSNNNPDNEDIYKIAEALVLIQSTYPNNLGVSFAATNSLKSDPIENTNDNVVISHVGDRKDEKIGYEEAPVVKEPDNLEDDLKLDDLVIPGNVSVSIDVPIPLVENQPAQKDGKPSEDDFNLASVSAVHAENAVLSPDLLTKKKDDLIDDLDDLDLSLSPSPLEHPQPPGEANLADKHVNSSTVSFPYKKEQRTPIDQLPTIHHERAPRNNGQQDSKDDSCEDSPSIRRSHP